MPVNEKTLDADLNDDGIVNFVDYAILLENWGKSIPLTDLTHYEYEANGLRVTSDVWYDPDLNMNVFDYKVFNDSGDTIFNLIFPGEQWVDGGGVHQVWEREVTDDFIRFYDGYIDNNRSEEFIAGSSLIDTWGIGPAKFESDAGNTFYVDTLIPMKKVLLEGDITGDDKVNIDDLIIMCNQWLSTEKWYAPQ